VKALLLAAGYATRLRPLTNRIAKPLLPVAGRPMADWILDRIEASGVVDDVHLVTNAVYADEFAAWGASRGVHVHDDGTRTNDDRLGAIGDIRFAVDRAGLGAGGLLVIGADNLFEFSIGDFVAFWRGKGGDGSAVAVHQLAERSLGRLYGIVETAAQERIVGFEEKPEVPRSDLAATATYLFSECHLALVGRYLDDGNAPDPPGRFLTWLVERQPVYAFRFGEPWLDIGNPEQLLEADNRYRRRLGMPEREVYSPD
jgi:glucose-1-phosphate thymidylyltransferase